jgi:glycosyltransferase involved in cell wall biosynthesis
MRRHLAYLKKLEEAIDTTRSRQELPDRMFDAIDELRTSAHYAEAFCAPNPLVSVCIATYNRASLLVERSVRSVLSQTYHNMQLIVVGDGCTDETEKRMARIRDDRVIFVNLPKRGEYPEVPEWRWMVAGTVPVNHALTLASGQFITHLDDDDEFLPQRIEVLISFAQTNRCEFVWHPFYCESMRGRWELKQCLDFSAGNVTTSSVLYHAWLKCIPWDIHAYRYREPGDWNRFRKFKYLGVRAMRFSTPLLRHYREHNQGLG